MKRVIVFGASSGIGKVTALFFAKKGWQVFAAARREDELKALEQENPNVTAVRCDVTKESDVKSAFSAALKGGVLDAVVVTAGRYVYDVPLEQTETDSWNTTLAVNLTGTMYIAREAAREFKAQKHGVLVTVSSLGGLNHRVWGGRAEYSVSKHGQTALMESAYREFEDLGIKARAFAICPGYVEGTEMVAGWAKKHPEFDGKGITPEAVAAAIYGFAETPQVFDSWVYTIDTAGLKPEYATS